MTAEQNLLRIREYLTLWPTRVLLEQANCGSFTRTRRTTDVAVAVGGCPIIIRNQTALDPQSVELVECATLDDYVAWLNSFVFFWPGGSLRPIENGVRMFHRTAGMRSVIIRVPTSSLLTINRDPYVTTCNAGAAWSDAGKKLPRGPHLFTPLDRCSTRAVDVHEICFRSDVKLPNDTECGSSPAGPWYVLRQNAVS